MVTEEHQTGVAGSAVPWGRTGLAEAGDHREFSEATCTRACTMATPAIIRGFSGSGHLLGQWSAVVATSQCFALGW